MAVSVFALAFLLFFPIVLEGDAHCDVNRKKLGFAVYLYKFLKVVGGYVDTYTGGIAIHVSEKKAFLIPYKQLNSERKRFSFVKTFRLIAFRLNTETGAEYILPVSLGQTVLRAYFFAMGGNREKIENNLRISLNCVIYFNLYIVLKNLFKFLKEKIKILWQKKLEKSTI